MRKGLGLEAVRHYLPPGQLLWLSMSVVGVLVAIQVFMASWGVRGRDTTAYWGVDLAQPYERAYGSFGAFVYSPAAAQLFSLVRFMPLIIFEALWLAVAVLALWWLTRRWALIWLLFPPVTAELYNGNIHLLLAVAIVAGFRYPAVWSTVLLTKITPGIGLLWLAVRREWRDLAIALGATAAVVAASFALAPTLWPEWLAFLRRSYGGEFVAGYVAIPLLPRLGAAIGLVVWGARRDARWTVPVAAMLALPTLFWGAFAMIVAVPALQRDAEGDPVLPRIAQTLRCSVSQILDRPPFPGRAWIGRPAPRLRQERGHIDGPGSSAPDRKTPASPFPAPQRVVVGPPT